MKIKIKLILTPRMVLLRPSSGELHCLRIGILKFTLTCSLLKHYMKIMRLILLAYIFVLHVRDEILELRNSGPCIREWRFSYFSESFCPLLLYLSDSKFASLLLHLVFLQPRSHDLKMRHFWYNIPQV